MDIYYIYTRANVHKNTYTANEYELLINNSLQFFCEIESSVFCELLKKIYAGTMDSKEKTDVPLIISY